MWRRGSVSILIGAAIAAFTGCIQDPSSLSVVAPGTVTTFVLVRHVERDPGLDPPLNAEGLLRAVALRDALAENGVTAIYCTDLIRNRESVQPLADALGLTLNLVNPARYVNTTLTAAELVDEMLAAHPGGTILFCGNRGSVLETPGITAEIYRRLGGSGEVPDRYQDMYVVVVPEEGASRIIKTEYGGPSSLD